MEYDFYKEQLENAKFLRDLDEAGRGNEDAKQRLEERLIVEQNNVAKESVL